MGRQVWDGGEPLEPAVIFGFITRKLQPKLLTLCSILGLS